MTKIYQRKERPSENYQRNFIIEYIIDQEKIWEKMFKKNKLESEK